MHPHEIDPSLCAAEPLPDSLADGFSPPADALAPAAAEHHDTESKETALQPKSPF